MSEQRTTPAMDFMGSDPLAAHEIEALDALLAAASPSPWVHEIGEHKGENWLLASFGNGHDDEDHQVTTFMVRCSEMDGDAGGDAEFVAAARNVMPRLLDDVTRMRAALEDIALKCPGAPAILARAGLGQARQLSLVAEQRSEK